MLLECGQRQEAGGRRGLAHRAEDGVLAYCPPEERPPESGTGNRAPRMLASAGPEGIGPGGHVQAGSLQAQPRWWL